MIMSSRERNLPQKKEGNTDENKITKASSSQRTWLGMKDPRIVRVPRCFGGKDRHSKVSTIKGLRDRRVRLSVPTAIQLYDLQEKLGLNQPSKVVDWLLNVTEHEIDKLPPLQMTPGIFGQYPQSPIIPHEVGAPQSSFLSLFDSNMKCVKDDFESRNKCKEVVNESTTEKSNWIKINEEEDHEEGIKVHSANLSAPNSFLNANHSSLPSLSNNGMPYNSYYQWDPSNLSLSHLGSQGYSFQEPYNYNVASLSSSLSLPHAGSPLLVCPSGTPPSLFPPYVSTPLVDFDPKQTNQYLQMLSSSSQNLVPNSLAPSLYSISPPVRPFQLNFPSKLLYPQNSSGSLSNKENGGKDCTND